MPPVRDALGTSLRLHPRLGHGEQLSSLSRLQERRGGQQNGQAITEGIGESSNLMFSQITSTRR